MKSSDIDQIIYNEISSEQKATFLAAAIGLSAGASLSVAVPVWLALQNQLSTAMIDFGVTVCLTPVPLFLVQNSSKNAGKRFTAELLGYLAVGATFPAMLCRFPTSNLPALGLAGMYEDDGRYKLAYDLMDMTCKNDQIIDTGKLLLLFNSGGYQQALTNLQVQMRAVEKLYKEDQSEKNRHHYFLVHSLAVCMLEALGRKQESMNIWRSIAPIARFDIKETAVAYVFNSMALAATKVADWQSALTFASKAREAFDTALGSRWLAGEIALNHAFAYLHLSEIEKAEEQIAIALNEWAMVMPSSAGAMAQAHYCRGLIEVAKGNYSEGSHCCEFALAIIRKRMGAMHPSALPILKTYSQCLGKLQRNNENIAINSEIAEIVAFHDMPDEPGEINATQFASIDPVSAPDTAQPKTPLDENELSLETISKNAASCATSIVNLSSLPFLLALPLLVKLALENTLFMYALVIILALGQITFSKYMRGRLEKRLLTKLTTARRVDNVRLNFRKPGWQNEFSATVTEKAHGLNSGQTVVLNASGLLIRQLCKGSAVVEGGDTTGSIFLNKDNNEPLVAVIGGKAFSIRTDWFSKINASARAVIPIGSSLVFYGAVIASLLFMVPMQVPRIVPEGKTPQEYYELGRKYKSVGWTEQARASLLRAIQSGNPELATKAKRYLDTKIPRYSQPEDAVLMNIKGFNADRKFFHANAEKIWLQCIKKYPNFEWPYGNLGSDYVEEGKYSEAEATLRKALEINPSYVNAWLYLADCKRKQHKFVEARQLISKALSLDPDDERARMMSLLPDF